MPFAIFDFPDIAKRANLTEGRPQSAPPKPVFLDDYAPYAALSANLIWTDTAPCEYSPPDQGSA